MRVLVQWAQATPGDWQAVDSRDWGGLPRRPDPTPSTPGADNAPGHIHRLCVQGVELQGDHYHVQHVDDSKIVVTVWTTDPRNDHCAHVWTFRTLRPDPKFWGALNTAQTHVVYAVEGSRCWEQFADAEAELHPWADFVPPRPEFVSHGKLLTRGQLRAHSDVAATHGWREWTEGLHPSEIDDDGRLVDQRAKGRYPAPDGTKTWYASDTAQAIGAYTADQELLLATSTATMGALACSLAGGTDEIGFALATASGEPDDAAWPTGTYRWQIDVSIAGSSCTYGLLTIGGSAGGFLRLASDLASVLETEVQTDSAYSGTGLKLASTGSVSWTAGSAGDRWGLALAVSNPGHPTQGVTIDLNEADDYTDGPWTAAAPHYVDAAVATGTGTANAATAALGTALSATAAVATGTGTANAATAALGTELTADATTASGAADGLAATVTSEAVTADAVTSSGAGDGLAATAALGSALSATAAIVSATATAIAADVALPITVDAVTASGAATAIAATASLGTAMTAAAATAAGTGTANAADVANGPALSTAAATADGDASGLAATVSSTAVSATAAAATGAGDALGATVTNGPALDATAATAAGTATANAASASVSASELTTEAVTASGAASAIAAGATAGPALDTEAATATTTATAIAAAVALGSALSAAAATASASATAIAAGAVLGSPDKTAVAPTVTATATANAATAYLSPVMVVDESATMTTAVDSTTTITTEADGSTVMTTAVDGEVRA